MQLSEAAAASDRSSAPAVWGASLGRLALYPRPQKLIGVRDKIKILYQTACPVVTDEITLVKHVGMNFSTKYSRHKAC